MAHWQNDQSQEGKLPLLYPEHAVLHLVPQVHCLVTTMDCEGASAPIFQRFQQICDIQLLAGNSGTILITS
ncbi:unnamed protein product, partial [Vitis vinifera]|uniref:Uncharacterized protein n=1 Tax=Vitis vinifera TaxID=29760 RepID=D7UAT5_VITVI